MELLVSNTPADETWLQNLDLEVCSVHMEPTFESWKSVISLKSVLFGSVESVYIF